MDIVIGLYLKKKTKEKKSCRLTIYLFTTYKINLKKMNQLFRICKIPNIL